MIKQKKRQEVYIFKKVNSESLAIDFEQFTKTDEFVRQRWLRKQGIYSNLCVCQFNSPIQILNTSKITANLNIFKTFHDRKNFTHFNIVNSYYRPKIPNTAAISPVWLIWKWFVFYNDFGVGRKELKYDCISINLFHLFCIYIVNVCESIWTPLSIQFSILLGNLLS